jgi:hypothetical protein
MLKESESPGRRRLFRLPSPAIVIAMIALLIATAGTAYGVKSVKHYPEFNGVDIIDHSLSGRDVKNGSLFAANLNSSVLRKFRGLRGLTGPAGAAGPAGPAGPAGAAGAPGVLKLIYRSSGALVNHSTLIEYGYVGCDAGYYAVGGGVNTGSTTQYVNASFPGASDGLNFSNTGWVAWVRNTDSVDHSATIYVICAPAGSVGKTSTGGNVAGKVGTSAKAMRPK